MKRMTCFFFIAALAIPAVGQVSEQEIRSRLDLIHSGKAEQVRTELPVLLRQYPNDVGVKYLDAYLTENGDQALRKYQSIVDQYPKNEWADDALYKVYQYYYAVGLYKTAEAKMNQLNEQYPTSIYVKREPKPDERIPVPAPVSTEPPAEKPAQPEQQTGQTSSTETVVGPFVVQVGVYSQISAAQQQARQLSSVLGRQAMVFAKQSGGKTVHAVAFDGFASDAAARAFGAELKSKHNLEWFVVKR